MPRPNKQRTLGSERTLAQRVAHERTSRDWTYERLAQRMTEVGCPIQASALYKIEKADPPRRVTVDELVALANVFESPIDELLLPAGLVLDRRAKTLLKKWVEARETLGRAAEAEDQGKGELELHLLEHPESRAAVDIALNEWARSMGWEVDEATSYWSMKLRGTPPDSEEYLAFMERYGDAYAKEARRGAK